MHTSGYPQVLKNFIIFLAQANLSYSTPATHLIIVIVICLFMSTVNIIFLSKTNYSCPYSHINNHPHPTPQVVACGLRPQQHIGAGHMGISFRPQYLMKISTSYIFPYIIVFVFIFLSILNKHFHLEPTHNHPYVVLQ